VITGTTKLLGVIGSPIEHSLSPVMQNAAISALRLNYVYLPFRVELQNLETAIAGFWATGLEGFNVTIPHKQAIIPLLREVTPLAQAVGAVNTVWRDADGWQGTNTDIEGFVAPLRDLRQDWSSQTAVVLGSGGAARAVVAGCAQLGLAAIYVVGRNPKRLKDFADSWASSSFTMPLTVRSWSDLALLIPKANLLVNTTPLGMHPQTEVSPIEDGLMQQLPVGAIVYDLIYTPRPTLFLQQAQRAGVQTLDGLEMLIQQGAAALNLWTQQSIPVDVMRRSLLDVLETEQKPLQ
jgi:shikimate dehydrogenase